MMIFNCCPQSLLVAHEHVGTPRPKWTARRPWIEGITRFTSEYTHTLHECLICTKNVALYTIVPSWQGDPGPPGPTGEPGRDGEMVYNAIH